MSIKSRRLVRAGGVFLALVLGLQAPAAAQTPRQLLPLVVNSDQSPLEAYDLYGIPVAAALNDAGDFAFVGLRGTGVYYRKAGTPSAVRVIQFGDEVPGLPGSRLAQIFTPFIMNASGLVAISASIYVGDRTTQAVLTYDGTTLKTLVTGLDTAPGSGGAKFEQPIILRDLNAGGDVLFSANLLPKGSAASALTSAFLIPAGGAPVRVAGPGDASPGTGGTFQVANGIALNSAGQVLLTAQITGGSGASGIFVWQSGTLRKVIAAGDANPLGGTFTVDFTTVTLRMTDSGLVIFSAASSLWQNTAVGGTTAAVGLGGAAPAPMGGTFNGITNFVALSQSGDAVFTANVTGGAGASGLFRFRPGSGVEVVARVGESAPGVVGKTFTGFFGPSVNTSGTVTFQGNASTGQVGLFQKPAGGALAAVVLHGDAAPVGGTLFFNSFGTLTLSSGAVFVRAHVMNNFTSGPEGAHHGAFLWSGGPPAVLMSTGDHMPAGGRLVVRPFFVTGSGNYVGVDYQRAGGRETIAVLNALTLQGNDVGTDGDFVDGTGGRLQFNNVNTVMVSAGGHVVVQANVFDGSIRPVILVGDLNQRLAAVFANGFTDNGGRQLFSPQLGTAASVRPIAINANGQAAFTATYNNNRGVWVGTTSGAPQKVAINGDLVSTGAAITSINAVLGGFNALGKALFTANTSAGQGLFVAAPGATPLKVAQVGDAAPGGGTFSGFGVSPMPGFNNVGQVAFVATVSGGSGGGVFLATLNLGGTYTLEAIALNGAASPAGGTFAITTALPDVVINDAGHVVFIADLSGGSANSGIFVRRPLASLETVVAQGQAAPGTAGNFSTFAHGVNVVAGEKFQVSASGQIAFYGLVIPAGGSELEGYWHAEPSGAIQPIALAPSAVLAFDGGTAATVGQASSWMSGDRYPILVHLAGAPHTGGLYMYVPLIAPVSTGTGANVTVAPTDSLTGSSVSVTFATVSVAGTTTLERGSTGPALPSWNMNNNLGNYYNISTTATHSGNITVCIDFADLLGGGPVPAGLVVRLLHYESSAWVDVTSSRPTPTSICGVVTSLSPFAIVAYFGSSVDLNGDGNGDAFVYNQATGGWARELSAVGGGFQETGGGWAPGWSIQPADFNADGQTDMFVFSTTSGQWYKLLGSGSGFTTQATGFWWPGWQRYVLDLDADGTSDLFLYDPASGLWYKCVSTPTGFTYVSGWWAPGWEPHPMNLNGDAYDDLFLISRTTGQWYWVLGASGGGFTYPLTGWWAPDWVFTPGDFNNDGLTDLLLHRPNTGQYYVAITTGAGFSYTSGWWPAGWTPTLLDLDGDGRVDVFIYDKTTGQWYELQGDGAGLFSVVGNGFWSPGWDVYPTNFNGDDRMDLLLYNPVTGGWYQAWNQNLGSFAYYGGYWQPNLTIIAGPIRR